MAVVTAAVTGVVGAGAAVAGTIIQKNAADDAKDASLKALQMQIDERKRITDNAREAARLSPNEIKSINQLMATRGATLSATMEAINKQQAQLDAMDPNVKAAGAELYKTLSGEATKVLAPIEKRLQRQRAERMNQLASQLGPGFMTTSAGIEAMNKFDTDAAMALNEVQQNYLTNITQSYLGLAETQMQGQQGVTNATGNLFGQIADIDKSVLNAYQTETSRLANAETGAANAAPVNFEGPANMFAKTGMETGNNLMNLGAGLGKIAGNLYGQNLFSQGLQSTSYGNVSPSAVPSVSSSLQMPAPQFSTGKYNVFGD